jgi:opacity protein-like surface antigen
MKLCAGFLLMILSTSVLAEGWSIAPRAGHQNMKIHNVGAEYISYSTTASNSGPIRMEYDYEKDTSASTAFFNSTVQGLRLVYALESLNLVSDLDFSRYFSTFGKIDLRGLGLAAQVPVVQTESMKLYGLLGFSMRSLKLRLYQTSYSYGYESIEYSGTSAQDITIDVVNYDAGLGSSFPLSESMSLIAEYKYSDTVAKGTFKSKTKSNVRNETHSVSYESSTKAKNYTVTTQELTLGLLFAL